MSAGTVDHAPTQQDIGEKLRAMTQIEELKIALTQNMSSRPANRRDDTPGHHTVGSMVNLLNNDMVQLIQEIIELRERLAPIRADRNEEKQGTIGKPVSCRVAAELADVHGKLEEARRVVYAISAEIDL